MTKSKKAAKFDNVQLVTYIGQEVRRLTIDHLSSIATSPPGSPPRKDRLLVAELVGRLDGQDRGVIESLIRDCVDTTIQQVLYMFDNVEPIANDAIHFELRNGKDGYVFNSLHSVRLCELYGKYLLDSGAVQC